MSIRKCCSLFHQWNDGVYNIGMLFVRSQVHNDIGSRQHFFVGTYFKTVLSRIDEGLAFVGDGFLT